MHTENLILIEYMIEYLITEESIMDKFNKKIIFNSWEELDKDNVSYKAEELFHSTLNERKLRMEKVNLDKDFDNLLSDSSIRNVFIRLCDK